MANPLSLEDEPGPAVPAGSTKPARFGLTAALVLYRDYRLLWGSTVLTQVGQWMLQITLGWLIYELTRSAAYVGLVGFASGIPFLVVSIPAGVLIDRMDRRRVLVTCQVAAGLIGLGLAVIVSLDVAHPWHVLIAAFLNGAVFAVNNATRQTLVPSFVGREHLQNGVALMSAGQNMTRILGPTLGGQTIALIGAAGALYLQSAFLALALVTTLLLPSIRTQAGHRLHLRRNLVDGMSYIARSPVLSGLMILATIPTLLIFPYLQFLPVYAEDILNIGAEGLGFLYAAGGFGAVVGSLAIAGLQNLQRKGLCILIGTTIYGFVIIAFAYSTWVPLSLLCLFLGGLLGSAFMSMNNTLLQLNVTDEVRGRVMGVYLLTWGLMPLGALPMGFVGDHFTVPHAITLGAGLTSLATIFVAIRSRAIRQL